jgi:hypothetical protein
MWYHPERSIRRNEVGIILDFGGKILKHPEARSLHAMWDGLRGDRPVPFRAELDAHRIGAKAPFLAILEYVGPSNFRIRIAGDRLNKWFGMELRGMSALALLDTEARNHFQATLNRVTAEPAVAALHGVVVGPDNMMAHFEMVLLPMRSDFGRVDRVLVGLWLLDAPALSRGPLRLQPEEFSVAAITEAGVSVARTDDALREAAEMPGPIPQGPAILRSIEGGAARDHDGAAGDVGSGGDDGAGSRPRGSHLRLVKKT